mgnify:CR=1 FL=1
MSDYIKPVVFKVGNEMYGVDINLVQSIEREIQVVPVPNSMPYIKGIVNLRSEVIPVYSLKKKFGLADNGVSENTIIIDTKNVKLALEVDEIGDIEPENIVPMPEIALNAQTQYMPRVANVDGNLIILLDVTELLSEEEEAAVKQMAEDMK